jgi:hypothetical protein
MYTGLHVKYPLILSGIKETWTSSADFQKNTQISNFIKNRPMGAELFQADRHDEANSRVSKFCKLG